MKDIKIEGFSLTIQEGSAGTVKISAVQCDSFNFYESEFIALARINISTIMMAFKQQSPQIKYLIKKSQDTLAIEFMIDLDFLPPFSESVALQKILGKEARMKMIHNQMKGQLSELESLLSKFKISNFRVQHKNMSVSANNGQLWEDVLAPGSYLVEISGFLTYDYVQAYDQMGNYLSNTLLPIQVSIEEAGQTRIVETFNLYSGPEYSYQQPFSFINLLTLKQEGKAYVKASKNATKSHNAYFSSIISSVSMISSRSSFAFNFYKQTFC